MPATVPEPAPAPAPGRGGSGSRNRSHPHNGKRVAPAAACNFRPRISSSDSRRDSKLVTKTLHSSFSSPLPLLRPFLLLSSLSLLCSIGHIPRPSLALPALDPLDCRVAHRCGKIVFKMLQARTSRAALQCLHRNTRRFSTTAPAAAVSPYKRSTSQIQKSQDVTPRRGQSTAAAKQADRPTPSPAFNREETSERFAPKNTPEMDHSFVGMKGGEIFHEMMLRHNVKHICEWPPQTLTLNDSH